MKGRYSTLLGAVAKVFVWFPARNLQPRRKREKATETPATRAFTAKTQKPTSHPVFSALKICISSKRLRSEVRKKALLETQ